MNDPEFLALKAKVLELEKEQLEAQKHNEQSIKRLKEENEKDKIVYKNGLLSEALATSNDNYSKLEKKLEAKMSLLENLVNTTGTSVNSLMSSNNMLEKAIQGEIARAHSGIQGIIDTIEKDVTDELDKSVTRFVKDMEQAAKRVDSLFLKYELILITDFVINALTFGGVLYIAYKLYRLHFVGF